MVHFSVKSHEMNKAHVHTPPEEKTKQKRGILLLESNVPYTKFIVLWYQVYCVCLPKQVHTVLALMSAFIFGNGLKT